jgi:hypothetical protein
VVYKTRELQNDSNFLACVCAYLWRQMAGDDKAKLNLSQTLLRHLLKESRLAHLDDSKRSEVVGAGCQGEGASGVELEIAAIEMLISRCVCSCNVRVV